MSGKYTLWAKGPDDTSVPLSVDAAGRLVVSTGGTEDPIEVVSSAQRSAQTANIANGASVSGVIDLLATALLGFIMPAAWTAAAITIEVSHDGVNFATAGAFGSDGSAINSYASPVAGGAYAVDVVGMLPWRYVRFRSGTSAAPVNQGAARAITVVTRPLA